MWKFQCVYLLSMHTNSRDYYGNILYCNIIHTEAYEKFMLCTFPFALKLKNTSAEFYYESRSEGSEVDNHLSGWKGPVFERKPPSVASEEIKIHPRSMEEVNVSLSWNNFFSPHYVGRSMFTWVSLPLAVTAFSAATWRQEALLCMSDPNGHDVHSFWNSMVIKHLTHGCSILDPWLHFFFWRPSQFQSWETCVCFGLDNVISLVVPSTLQWVTEWVRVRSRGVVVVQSSDEAWKKLSQSTRLCLLDRSCYLDTRTGGGWRTVLQQTVTKQYRPTTLGWENVQQVWVETHPSQQLQLQLLWCFTGVNSTQNLLVVVYCYLVTTATIM